jgi:hypothetical protein
MKKKGSSMRRIFFILIILMIIPAGKRADGVSFTAEMGLHYRTVRLKIINSIDEPFEKINYLAVAHGLSHPASVDFDAYLTGANSDGLNDGSVVRGSFNVSGRFTRMILELRGRENVASAARETGFKDGTRYDIFLQLVTSAGEAVYPDAFIDVMAQPFESVSDKNVCKLRNARQLANIQRLAETFVKSSGAQGSMQFLTSGRYSYVLSANISLSGRWTPIGDYESDARYVFRGGFDGNGYKITGLRDSLFGRAENARISNLTVGGADIRRKGDAGVIAAQAEDTSFIACSVMSGKVRGDNAGGLAGRVSGNVTVNRCVADVTVAAVTAGGGLIGVARGKEISENAKQTLKIVNCVSEGAVSVKNGTAGGLTGVLEYAYVSNCEAQGKVTTTDTSAALGGGFTGRLDSFSRITNSLAVGDVSSAGGTAGGFTGIVGGGSCAEYCVSSGSVRASNAGGFVGRVDDVKTNEAPNTVADCISFAQWVVGDKGSSTHRFAGCVKFNGINNCYAYLGSMVATGGGLLTVKPGAYAADGADANLAALPEILNELRWPYGKTLARRIKTD